MLLARVLRLLATNHIFIEVSPDVFANNRLSSVLDTGKSVQEILTRFAQVQWIATANSLLSALNRNTQEVPG